MKNLLVAGRLLLLDLASTFFFLIVYSVTKNIALSVVLGMALGVVQIGWEFACKKPIDTMARLVAGGVGPLDNACRRGLRSGFLGRLG
jgi:hypothetical protein